MFMPGLDLNFAPLFCNPGMNIFPGVIDAYRQAGVCAVDGTSAADDFSSLCGALWWTSQDQAVHLFGSIPVDGLCAMTFRESLRDIEACLRAQSAKLYHLGIRSIVSRNTLANANATRDWRIYCEFAQRLIAMARRLYANEPFGVDLKDTVYALDATTIDLCLSVFPWAPFRSTKAAIKLHTLLDLRGNIPSFIHISDGKWHEVNLLDELIVEPGASM